MTQLKEVLARIAAVRQTRPRYGRFDDPVDPSEFTRDECRLLIDAGIVLDLRAPEDKEQQS